MKESGRYYKEGVDIANQANQKHIYLALIYNNLGKKLDHERRFEEALEHLIKAKELLDTCGLDNYDYMLERNTNIRGIINDKLGKTDEAEELLIQAQEMIESNPIESFNLFAISPFYFLELINY